MKENKFNKEGKNLRGVNKQIAKNIKVPNLQPPISKEIVAISKKIFHDDIQNISKQYGVEEIELTRIIEGIQWRCQYCENSLCQYFNINKTICTPYSPQCLFNDQYKKQLESVINIKKKLQLEEDRRPSKNNIISVPKSNIADIKRYASDYKLSEDIVAFILNKAKKKCMYRANDLCKHQNNIMCSPCRKTCMRYEMFKSLITAESQKQNMSKLTEIRKPQGQGHQQKSHPTKSEAVAVHEIGVKDFLVRSNVFKCMHNDHVIENVSAMISIDNDGKKKAQKISAGYCQKCKVYFIMESTYQRLKSNGLILCRITDEKSYKKSEYMNGAVLAHESILMQYGYNVSEIKGLSATKRQKILAVIIDNNVLSKSEIISYLDFFINQRSSRSNMERAISKWEADREFVENYRIGEYSQYGVNAIYRR